MYWVYYLVLNHKLHDHVETKEQFILVEQCAAHLDLQQFEECHLDVFNSLHVIVFAWFCIGACIPEL